MTDRRNLTLGIVLLLLGIYFLLWRSIDFSRPGAILVLLGVIFLTLSALRRFRGPLLPGGVLLGLGSAFLLQEPLSGLLPRWATIVLGIGCGFLLVAALDRAVGRDRRPAPVVPGVILVSIALVAALARRVDLSSLVFVSWGVWPWLLVLGGIALIATSFARRKA